MIIDFPRFDQFLTRDGTLTLRASEYLRQLTRETNLNTPLTGSGSPEGVLAAEPTQRYMDTSGTAGSILYIKKTGTGDTGWILT